VFVLVGGREEGRTLVVCSEGGAIVKVEIEIGLVTGLGHARLIFGSTRTIINSVQHTCTCTVIVEPKAPGIRAQQYLEVPYLWVGGNPLDAQVGSARDTLCHHWH